MLRHVTDILGHIDKIKMRNTDNRYFSDTDAWYRKARDDTLDVAAETGVVVEVNTRSMYKKKIHNPTRPTGSWRAYANAVSRLRQTRTNPAKLPPNLRKPPRTLSIGFPLPTLSHHKA